MVKAWTDSAWEDFEYWTRQDRKTLKKILDLLRDITATVIRERGSPNRSKEICQDIGVGG